MPFSRFLGSKYNDVIHRTMSNQTPATFRFREYLISKKENKDKKTYRRIRLSVFLKKLKCSRACARETCHERLGERNIG